MSYIDKNKYSMSEVKDYIEKNNKPLYMTRLVEVRVDSNAFNNGTSRDYPFCHTIKHPETGETLYPVKGYMGVNELNKDRCYYAEYMSKKGEYYSYTYKFAMVSRDYRLLAKEISIGKQRKEDDLAYDNKFNKTEEAGQMGE